MPEPRLPRWRTLRVFVSSTFRDMQSERDALVRVVFPALRERLERHRVYLNEVDLRWGLTQEQADNDEALELCLQQVDECRPFFVGMLGERYGWVPRHVREQALARYPWLSEFPGCSITELEMLHGALRTATPTYALFCLRDPSLGSLLPPELQESYMEIDPVRARLLAELKARIRQAGFPLLDGYTCHWQSPPSAGSRDQGQLVVGSAFAARIEDELWRAMRQHLALTDTENLRRESLPRSSAEQQQLEAETEDYDRFIAARLRLYVGRDDIHRQLLDWVGGEDVAPLVLIGAPGTGKSSVLARLVRERQQAGAWVTSHFVGASSRSTSLRLMLRRFCLQLTEALGAVEPVPQTAKELAPLFRDLLARMPAHSPVLIVIDAVDQLESADRAHDLLWLPRQLPTHVKLILSVAERAGSRSFTSVRELGLPELTLQELTVEERLGIIRGVPALWAKTLDSRQSSALLANPQTANPLYLLVAIEELRGFGSFEQLDARIRAFPVGDGAIVAIFTQVLARLERDFGAELAADVASRLGAARRGMSEQELRDGLQADVAAGDLFVVLRQLRPYLARRNTLIAPFHSGLADAIRERYLGTSSAKQRVHARLADYFSEQPDWFAATTPHERIANARKADELSWQRLQAEQLDALAQLLMSPAFLESKVEADLLFDLLSDYESALQVLPAGAPRTILQLLNQAARIDSGFIARHPSTLFQCLWNSGFWYDSPAAARHFLPSAPSLTATETPARLHEVMERWRAWKSSAQPDSLWLRALRPPFERLDSGRDIVIRAQSDRLFAVAFSPDGRRVASAGRDRTIGIYDVSDGTELARCHGHTAAVNAICFTPDGLNLISGSEDASVRCWNGRTGDPKWSATDFAALPDFVLAATPLTTSAVIMRGLSALGMGVEWTVGKAQTRVTAVACAPDGTRTAAVVCGNLIVLDVASGTILAHRGLPDTVLDSLAWSVDGALLALGVSDGTARLLDARSFDQLSVLSGHAAMTGYSVPAIAFSPCGRYCATGDFRGTVRMWQRSDATLCWATRVEVPQSQRAEDISVSSLAFSADGARLLAATSAGRVHVFAVQSGTQERALELHSGWVRGVACSPLEDKVASCGDDRTLQLFTLSGTTPPPQLAGHSGIVGRIRYSGDGKQLASATTRGDIILWDAATSTVRLRIMDPAIYTGGLAFSPDAERLATASNSSEIRIWDTSHGDELRHFSGCDRAAATCIEYSPDGALLASGSYDHVVLIQDADSGRGVLCLEGYDARSNALTSLPGSITIAGANTGQVSVWATGADPVHFGGHTGPVTCCVALPARGAVVSAGSDGTVRSWDIAARRALASRGDLGDVSKLICSADEELIFVATGQVLHALESRELEPRFSLTETDFIHGVTYLPQLSAVATAVANELIIRSAEGTEQARFEICPKGQYVSGIACSRQEPRLFVLTNEPKVRVFDYLSRTESQSIELPAAAREIALSPTEEVTALRFSDVILLCHLASGASTALTTQAGTFCAMAFSPDGRILSAAEDNTIRSWDATGACIETFSGPDTPAPGLPFEFPYGRKLSPSRGSAEALLDAASGAILMRVRRLAAEQMALPFSPDGTRLACVSDDYELLVIELATREVRLRLSGHSARINALAFSDDGRRLATGSRDKTVRLWDALSGECLRVYEGRGDVRAIANGPPRYPWLALVRNAAETEIVSAETGETVAWFPAPMLPIVTHPSGVAWCGVEYTKQFFVHLEPSART